MNNPDIEQALGRWPDFIVGDTENPYLLRWFIIPRNRFFNIYLHKFCRSDDDRALHDHPWLFNCSILIDGAYYEHFLNGKKKFRRAGTLSGLKFRFGKAPHRVQLLENSFTTLENPCWTIFITGPRVREWGFYCPKGWRHWKMFVANTDTGNTTGRGCE